MTIILALDTETSGLDPVLHTVWEVAWQMFDHDTTDRTIMRALTPMRCWQVPLTPDQIAVAQPVGLEIGRYHERVGHGPTASPTEVLARLRHDIASCALDEPVFLLGACPWFDETMLARWWGGSVNDRPWHYHLIDIESLIAGAVTPPAMAPWKYADLLARIGVRDDPAGKHTAAGDVAVVVEAYRTIYQAVIV